MRVPNFSCRIWGRCPTLAPGASAGEDSEATERHTLMPHDQAYLQAEKKIEETLKSGATELFIQCTFICFAKQSVENKGGSCDA